MLKKRTKYIIGFLIIMGALVYLISTTFQSSLQYYVTVAEYLNNTSKYKSRTLKVAGIAADIQTSLNADGKTVYNFNVNEEGKGLAVSYLGFVPDTFKNGAQVVVTGRMNEGGNFEATEILAKCASKYESKVRT